MSRLTKYMPAVVGYRQRLATLQGAWDSLALLSHSSDDGTNLSNTREAFESLAADLVTVLVGQRIFDAEFALSEVTRGACQNDLPFP